MPSLNADLLILRVPASLLRAVYEGAERGEGRPQVALLRLKELVQEKQCIGWRPWMSIQRRSPHKRRRASLAFTRDAAALAAMLAGRSALCLDLDDAELKGRRNTYIRHNQAPSGLLAPENSLRP